MVCVWAKVRRMLSDPRSRNFLDRLQRDLAAACPRAELREVLVALWRLRHATRPGYGAVGIIQPVVQALLAGKLAADGQGVYRAVARVLSRVVRRQQRGGVFEQRGPDAASTSSDAASAVAGPEASVLELPGICRG